MNIIINILKFLQWMTISFLWEANSEQLDCKSNNLYNLSVNQYGGYYYDNTCVIIMVLCCNM